MFGQNILKVLHPFGSHLPLNIELDLKYQSIDEQWRSLMLTWGQCYTTFFVPDLRVFVLSQSVCQTRLEKLSNDNYSSLSQKSIVQGQKCFVTLGPGVDLLKLFCCNFTQSFQKLDHFINVTVIFLSCEKIQLSKKSE